MYLFMAKQNQGEESEDEPEFIISSPCFKIDPNTELTDNPTNGHEFLRRVMAERKKCRSITLCSKDISKFTKNQSCYIDGIPELKPAPDVLKPTAQWQEIQVTNFSEVRKCVIKERLEMKPTSNQISQISDINFLVDQPKMSKVLALRQMQLINGLNILSEMLQEVNGGDTISKDIGVWIYSLLACLHMPCHSETISILRDIARQCASIRAHISLEDSSAQELAAPLNLIICLVAKYFRQIDLADTDCPDE